MDNLNIVMPRIGTNDNTVTLGTWLVQNGEYVKKGQAIAVLETTKETQDLIAEKEGYLFYKVTEGEDIKVGNVVAFISDQADFVFPDIEKENLINLNITKKAQELIKQYNVDIKKLSHLSIIREKDVLQLVKPIAEISRSKANDLIIVSGGGMAKMCIDVIRQTKAFNIHGITDPKASIGSQILGVDVLGDDSVLEDLYQQGYMTAVNAIGGIANDNAANLFYLRKQVYEKIKEIGFFVPNLIHPTASIEPSAMIGEGNIILAGASVGSDARIGNNCIINTGAIVSHDCVISNHAKLSPGSILAGNVHIGENSLIGMGVTIYIGVKIGKNVIISNGKNIFQDVPDNTVIK